MLDRKHPPVVTSQVTHVVSQTDVVKTLLDNKAAFGAALQATVEQLELDDGACMTGEGAGLGAIR